MTGQENIKPYLIMGGGISGLLLSYVLADLGYPVICADLDFKNKRDYAIALWYTSLYFLKAYPDIYKKLHTQGNPLNMQLIEDLTTGKNNYLSKIDFSQQLLGISIPLKILHTILKESLQIHPNAQLVCDTIIGAKSQDKGALVIGKKSTYETSGLFISTNTRQFFPSFIPTPTPFQILTAYVSTLGLNQSISYEFYRNEGPFTLLPTAKNKFNITWVMRKNNAPENITTHKGFLKEAHKFLQGRVPELHINPKVPVYKLSLSTCVMPTYCPEPYITLFGEGAHLFSPVGAQGYNTTVNDIHALRDLMKPSPTSPTFNPVNPFVYRQYDKIRRYKTITLQRSLMAYQTVMTKKQFTIPRNISMGGMHISSIRKKMFQLLTHAMSAE